MGQRTSYCVYQRQRISAKEYDLLEENNMLPFQSSAKVSSMSTEDVIRDYRSDVSSGLTNEEAEGRKRIYGLNEFDVGEETPLWRKYFDQVGKYSQILMISCHGVHMFMLL